MLAHQIVIPPKKGHDARLKNTVLTTTLYCKYH